MKYSKNLGVRCRHFAEEAHVSSRVSPHEIYDGQSGTSKGPSLGTSVFPYLHHSTDTLHANFTHPILMIRNLDK
jgi:hypothetical protein